MGAYDEIMRAFSLEPGWSQPIKSLPPDKHRGYFYDACLLCATGTFFCLLKQVGCVKGRLNCVKEKIFCLLKQAGDVKKELKMG